MRDLLQELIGKIKRKGLVLGLCAAGTIFGGGESVRGGVIATAPQPAADGAYELGNRDFFDHCFSVGRYGKDALAEGERKHPFKGLRALYLKDLGYPDWASLALPEGSVVRFTGGVLLDDLPACYTYDWSQATHVCLISDIPGAGRKLTIPAGLCAALFAYDLTKSADGTTFTLTLNNAKRQAGFHADLQVDGTLYPEGGTAPFDVYGALSGSGVVSLGGFYTEQCFFGPICFDGVMEFGASQAYQKLFLFPPETRSVVKNFNLAWRANLKTLQYAPCLANGETGVLAITNQLSSSPDCALQATGDRRYGNGILVYSNNTVHVHRFENGGLHLVADPEPQAPTFQHGFGHVIFDRMGNSGNVTVFPSANLNLTTGLLHWGRTFEFDYTGESNAVNVSTLDFSKENHAARVTIRGFSPAFLPRRILADPVRLAGVTNVVLDADWTFPFDFAAADPEEINPWRCESMGALQAPEAGTITISAQGGRPVSGIYPLMTCTTGGEALKNWTVSFTGNWYGAERTVLTDETGLRLKILMNRATVVTFR